MAYNVPTNAIEANFLYVNIGAQDVVYNSITYTTGQVFTGVSGIATFTYSGSGSQIVNEVEIFKGGNIEFVNNVDISVYPETLVWYGADVTFFPDPVFNDIETIKGADLEIDSKLFIFSISKRIAFKIPPVIYTPPTAIKYFGDSMTVGGIGSPAPTNPYPYLVNAINGIAYTNNGVGGTTVKAAGIGGSNFFNKYGAEITLGYTGQFVSAMYGYNDSAGGVINSTWKADLKAIWQAFITAGFPANKLLMCADPVGSNIQMILYCYEIASELGIQFYNVSQRFIETGKYSTLIGGDGIHPNDAGQALITSGFDTFIKR